MKRLLSLIAALVLVPTLAFAGWNLRQSDDGTAEWIDGDADTIPIGRDLHVRMADMSTAATVFVVSPITGTLTQIWTVLHGAITTADSLVTVSVAPADSTTFVDYTSQDLTVGWSGSAAGTMDTMTLTGVQVDAGGVIAIRTDGSSTNTALTDVTIRIEGN